eukprot:gene3559-6169_t
MGNVGSTVSGNIDAGMEGNTDKRNRKSSYRDVREDNFSSNSSSVDDGPFFKKPKAAEKKANGSRRKSTGRSDRRSFAHFSEENTKGDTVTTPLHTNIPDSMNPEDRFMLLFSQCFEQALASASGISEEASKEATRHVDAVVQSFLEEIKSEDMHSAAVTSPVLSLNKPRIACNSQEAAILRPLSFFLTLKLPTLTLDFSIAHSRPNPKNVKMRQNLELYKNTRARLKEEEEAWNDALLETQQAVRAVNQLVEEMHSINKHTDSAVISEASDTKNSEMSPQASVQADHADIKRQSHQRDSCDRTATDSDVHAFLQHLETQIKPIEHALRVFQTIHDHVESFTDQQRIILGLWLGLCSTNEMHVAVPSKCTLIYAFEQMNHLDVHSSNIITVHLFIKHQDQPVMISMKQDRPFSNYWFGRFYNFTQDSGTRLSVHLSFLVNIESAHVDDAKVLHKNHE